MKHDKALGKNGVIYSPSDIFDINKLVDMRYYGLTDLEGQFELVAVNGKKKKYFRFKHSPGKDLSRLENNPSHDKIKNELLSLLRESTSLRVFTNEFLKVTDSEGNTKTATAEKALLNLPNNIFNSYQWNTEVFKRVSKNEYTLFDICGFAKDTPFPTSAKPIVVFEIIVSSFVKSPVFKFMCDDSEINFTLCFFIYVPENAINRKDYRFYWNEIMNSDNALSIRITQHIDNGYFHQNEHQIKGLGDIENDEELFERPDTNHFNEYYEYWEKHYLYIKEKYFKTAVSKLK